MEDFVPYLIAVRPVNNEFEHLITKILLNQDEVSIGRSLDNTIIIADVHLSRSHCIIKKSLDHWIIKDMSSCGILINKKKIEKNTDHILKENDLIQLDLLGEYVYKFIMTCDDDDYTPPRTRRKLDETECIDNIKVKFEESQSFAIEHLERKIQNTKQLQSNSMILKEHLEVSMAQKMQQLKDDFKEQIANLKGEKDQVEKQKLALEVERDKQLSGIKQEMDEKIAELMQKIQKLNENESELLQENNALKEEMLAEREKFLSELNRESTSKQTLLEQLTARIKEQEEIRLKEKQEFVEQLKCQVDYFQAAKDKELEELAQQKILKEKELGNMLQNVREELQNQIETEQKLQKEMEEMQKKNEEEKLKLEQLLQAREAAEKEMAAALEVANKSVIELQTNMKTAAEEAEELKQKEIAEAEAAAELDAKLKAETLNEFGALMENELQCSICSELFIKSTTLNCSHTFCEYCINKWTAKRNECPMCRSAIKSKCRSLALDSFIDKMLENLTEEMRTKREIVLKDRQKAESNSLSTTKRRHNRRAITSDDDVEEEEEYEDGSLSSNSLSSDTSMDLEEEEDEDLFAWTNELPSSPENSDVVPGLPGARYGGYGRCYKCRRLGHWAPGCPFY